MLYVSESLKDAVTLADYFQIDGHFKTAPRIPGVYQQLTIMPVAFDHVSYVRFFNVLLIFSTPLRLFLGPARRDVLCL